MTSNNKASSSSANKNTTTLLTSLSKTNNVVSTTLHSHINQHITKSKKEYNASKDGLDYLHVKNGIMISYLIDLTLLLRYRLNAASSSATNNNSNSSNNNEEEEMKQCINRLHEMRTTLTKIRPLEKKLRYQIDKLLALSTLGSGTFAAVRKREVEDEDEKEVGGGKSEEGDWKEGMEGGLADGIVNHNGSDPLSFKPDLQGMMKMFEEDNDDEVRYVAFCVLHHIYLSQQQWHLLSFCSIRELLYNTPSLNSAK